MNKNFLESKPYGDLYRHIFSVIFDNSNNYQTSNSATILINKSRQVGISYLLNNLQQNFSNAYFSAFNVYPDILNLINSGDNYSYKGNLINIRNLSYYSSDFCSQSPMIISCDDISNFADNIHNVADFINKIPIAILTGNINHNNDIFKYRWMLSSQKAFNLKCEKCNEYFPLHIPNTDNWENVWVEKFTVKCSHCDHLQDKNKATNSGMWVAANDSAKFDSYYFNTLLVPTLSKEYILKLKNQYTQNQFKSDVLGDFCEIKNNSDYKCSILSADECNFIKNARIGAKSNHYASNIRVGSRIYYKNINLRIGKK